MNKFYLVVDLLYQRLSNNENVNTVIVAKKGDEDLYKKNIYPNRLQIILKRKK